MVDLRAGFGTVAISPGPPAEVTMWGEFDLTQIDELEVALAAIPTADVVLHLAPVQFCSSRALRCLLQLRERVTDSGHLIQLASISRQLERLIDVTDTARLFPRTAIEMSMFASPAQSPAMPVEAHVAPRSRANAPDPLDAAQPPAEDHIIGLEQRHD